MSATLVTSMSGNTVVAIRISDSSTQHGDDHARDRVEPRRG